MRHKPPPPTPSNPSPRSSQKPSTFPSPPSPHFPPTPNPRIWLITAGTSAIGISVARACLAHGDKVVAGVKDAELAQDNERVNAFREFYLEECVRRGWREGIRGVGLTGRIMGECQAAVATCIEVFGRIDVVFECCSETLIGTVEELAATTRTQALMREQFETNFFGPVNQIKAAIPAMRKQHSGHVIVLTAGHLGTPGMGMYCASNWALEGYCDSMAYEIAPFNIKMTIVQPTMEIGVLTNKIVSVPPQPQYTPEKNPAPLVRGIIDGLLERIEGAQHYSEEEQRSLVSDEIVSIYPRLPMDMKATLLAETVSAITAIGGHENPPARHIVGHEGVASVKEKLKTVSEELEDFVEVSCAVDIEDRESHEGENGVTKEGP